MKESMCDEDITIEGTNYYVYYDYEYHSGEPDVGVDGGYDINIRIVFDEFGAPINLNARQTQLAEWILADRLKDRGGK